MFRLFSNSKEYFARRAYQSKLPNQLRALYGECQQYTPTQITIAIRKAGLNVAHRQLAYELYLTKEEIQSFQQKTRTHRENISCSSE